MKNGKAGALTLALAVLLGAAFDAHAQSTDATLTNLVVTDGTNNVVLSPAFAAATNSYDLSVRGGIASLKITPTAAAGAAFAVNKGNTELGTSGTVTVTLDSGENAISIVVTAEDGTTTMTYAITATRLPVSSDATLSNLVVTPGTLTPAFAKGTLSYDVGVRHDSTATGYHITPTAEHAGATIQAGRAGYLDGVTSGATAEQAIDAGGDNTFLIVVTAEDGTTTMTYTAKFMILPSDDATLTSLVINDGTSDLTLSPAFDSATDAYTLSVRGSITNLKITPTAAADATFAVNKDGSEIGTSGTVTVAPGSGETAISIVVTAENGTTTMTYSIAVTRQSISTDATLTNLVVNDGTNDLTLSPAFDSATDSYTLSVRGGTASLQIMPTADAYAAFAVNKGGNEIGTSGTVMVTLTTGENTISIVVTAEDGLATMTYAITVMRLPISTDATLTNLVVNDGTDNLTLSPAFDSATDAYALSVRDGIASLEITPTAASYAAFAVNKGAVELGTSGTVSATLTTGENAISIVVTAEDGTTTTTYAITVTRLPMSGDSTLSNLTVSPGTLTPAFNSGTTEYTSAIGNNASQFRITPTANHAGASIKVGRLDHQMGLTSGSESPGQGTEVGGTDNVFLVEVTAESSTVTTYTIDVFRAGSISKLLVHDSALTTGAERTDAASLLAIADFDPLDDTYAFSVERAVAGVILTPTYSAGSSNYQRTQPSASPASPATLASNAASAAIPLAGGANLVELNVGGAVYMLAITRAPDAPSGLAATPAGERLDLAWSALSGDAPSGYRVRWRLKDADGGGAGTAPGDWQSASASDNDGEDVGDVLRYAIADLVNGTTYQTQVAAVNSAGIGEWSASVEAAPFEALAFASAQEDLLFLAGRALAEAVVLPNAQYGTPPYTFAVEGLPSGLVFNDAADTREITGTPVETVPPAEVTYTVTDAASGTFTQSFTISAPAFNLDVDATGGATAQDGILIARYLLEVRGESLRRGQSNAEIDALQATLKAGVDTKALDVSGDGIVDGDDGFLIVRYLLGLRGDELFAGFAGLTDAADRAEVVAKIAALMP